MGFEETLPLGLGVLAIGFEGILNDKMKGFYRRYSLYIAYLVKRIFFSSFTIYISKN